MQFKMARVLGVLTILLISIMVAHTYPADYESFQSEIRENKDIDEIPLESYCKTVSIDPLI
jgi:hypothetical protein